MHYLLPVQSNCYITIWESTVIIQALIFLWFSDFLCGLPFKWNPTQSKYPIACAPEYSRNVLSAHHFYLTQRSLKLINAFQLLSHVTVKYFSNERALSCKIVACENIRFSSLFAAGKRPKRRRARRNGCFRRLVKQLIRQPDSQTLEVIRGPFRFPPSAKGTANDLGRLRIRLLI